MLKATCKHCSKDITYKQGDNGQWRGNEKKAVPHYLYQYCWIDPIAGSQLHEPNMDTIKEEQAALTVQPEKEAPLAARSAQVFPLPDFNRPLALSSVVPHGEKEKEHQERGWFWGH